jgi:hypothetical protein
MLSWQLVVSVFESAVVEQGAVDDVGQAAAQGSDRFSFRIVVHAFLQVSAGFGVVAGLGDGDAVQRGVELAVAAAVEPVAFAIARPYW